MAHRVSLTDVGGPSCGLCAKQSRASLLALRLRTGSDVFPVGQLRPHFAPHRAGSLSVARRRMTNPCVVDVSARRRCAEVNHLVTAAGVSISQDIGWSCCTTRSNVLAKPHASACRPHGPTPRPRFSHQLLITPRHPTTARDRTASRPGSAIRAGWGRRGPTKSRRTLALPRLMVQQLRVHQARQARDRLRSSDRENSSLVFATRAGTRTDAANVRRDSVVPLELVPPRTRTCEPSGGATRSCRCGRPPASASRTPRSWSGTRGPMAPTSSTATSGGR